jgi:hypothetical protein
MTISTKLTDINVKAYFSVIGSSGQLLPPLPPDETLISGGTGVLTITLQPPAPPPQAQLGLQGPQPPLPVRPFARYYLQVDTGERVHPLRLGQQVIVTGVDAEKKVLAPAEIFETVNTGTPAVFVSPVPGFTG